MQHSSSFHPVHKCDDGLFNTANGMKIDLHRPTSEMIDIRDIAGALSKISRFGGHTSAFYSVAQHSVIVAHLAPETLKREALLHDATEAYLGDVIKPLKVILGADYMALEMKFTTAISEYFGIDLHATHEQLKPYDRQALEIEHEALQKGNMGPLMNVLNLHGLLMFEQWAWTPTIAQMAFMAAYHQYFKL